MIILKTAIFDLNGSCKLLIFIRILHEIHNQNSSFQLSTDGGVNESNPASANASNFAEEEPL